MGEAAEVGESPSTIGRVDVYDFDDGWHPVLTIGEQEYDLPAHPTVGAAVDAAFKWAADRCLILTWPVMTIRNKP